MNDALKRDAFDWVDKSKPRVIDLSDRIWLLAELGLVEYKSSELLARVMEEFGFRKNECSHTFEQCGPK